MGVGAGTEINGWVIRQGRSGAYHDRARIGYRAGVGDSPVVVQRTIVLYRREFGAVVEYSSIVIHHTEEPLYHKAVLLFVIVPKLLTVPELSRY